MLIREKLADCREELSSLITPMVVQLLKVLEVLAAVVTAVRAPTNGKTSERNCDPGPLETSDQVGSALGDGGFVQLAQTAALQLQSSGLGWHWLTG